MQRNAKQNTAMHNKSKQCEGTQSKQREASIAKQRATLWALRTPQEDPGKPLQNLRNRPPEGPGSLDFNRGRYAQTYPGGGGTTPGSPRVITTSSKDVLCGVA